MTDGLPMQSISSGIILDDAFACMVEEGGWESHYMKIITLKGSRVGDFITVLGNCFI